MASSSRCVGIDFGTSNCAAVIAGSNGTQPAKTVLLDPSAEVPSLLRSVLFFADGENEATVGSQAISRYAEDEEGRFIQSVKSFLPQALFSKTTIGRKTYTLAELVKQILLPIRKRIEDEMKGPIDKVVFGRPAVFSDDPKIDAFAEQRLDQAARLAGFGEPIFLIEPIAAALQYEATLDHDELVLVGDFGAGTSDFTLIKLGPNRSGTLDRKDDVVASTGCYVGGDNFDAAIVEHALLRHFGSGSTYMDFAKQTDLPAWIIRKMTRWHELSFLRDPKLMNFLRQAELTSSDPKGIRNFLCLLEENLGYNLFMAVEACKRGLSDHDQASVCFSQGDIELDVAVQRQDFEQWMQPLLQRIDAAVSKVLAANSVASPDAVFLTGGTSKIPAVAKLFEQRFGIQKIRSGDTFLSVAGGLGRAAAALNDR